MSDGPIAPSANALGRWRTVALLCYVRDDADVRRDGRLCGPPGSQTAPVEQPFDALIIPGCPTLSDGALSRCLQARAVWAALLWERGQAATLHHVGISGLHPICRSGSAGGGDDGDGVPADRFILNRTRCTPRKTSTTRCGLRRKRLAANRCRASDRGQALGACRKCCPTGTDSAAFSMETSIVDHRRSELDGLLSSLRAPKVSEFLPLSQRERDRAKGKIDRATAVVFAVSGDDDATDAGKDAVAAVSSWKRRRFDLGGTKDVRRSPT